MSVRSNDWTPRFYIVATSDLRRDVKLRDKDVLKGCLPNRTEHYT